jgi:steroid 5-alpha reductase family enzyme
MLPMPDLTNLLPSLFAGLQAIVLLMLLLWLVSVYLQNVSIIDLFWGPAIATGATAYWLSAADPGARATLVLVFAWLWALRLGIYLTGRNFGKPEDRRYADMRRRHDPGFWLKSLLLVFALQAVLAWIVGLPLFGAIHSAEPLVLLDYLGAAIFLFGWIWESIADWQLARFLRTRTNQDAVLDYGVWRYSRHPNYFGEFTLWWGLWLIAVAGGAWWTIVGPLLLSFFLLKVSGVAMLEKDIAERRPAYREYIRKTSAFIPRPPRA